MLFVEISFNYSFIFSVFAFTALQSLVLSDGNLVFFSDIILLNFSMFFSSSYVSACYVWFDCVVFRSFLLCDSFSLDCSCFSVFGMTFIVTWFCCCDSLFIFGVFLIFPRSENRPFFIIVLTCLANLWLVVWNLAHSSQISIILFLYPHCVGLLQK